jgi:hypothetical protein
MNRRDKKDFYIGGYSISVFKQIGFILKLSFSG